MFERAVTGSMLYDLVTCEHRAWLDVHGEHKLRDSVGPFVSMLWRCGLAHERATLAGIAGEAVDLRGLPHEQAERDTLLAISSCAPIIFGGRLRSKDLLGEPDLLVREAEGYVAGDVKCGSGEDEMGRRSLSYGVQVAHYSMILANLGLGSGREAFIIDGAGRRIQYPLDAPLASRGAPLGEIHSDCVGRARRILGAVSPTRPALCSGCKLCHWRSVCRAELTRVADLTLVPQLGRALRSALEPRVRTLEELAAIVPEAEEVAGGRTTFSGIGIERLRRFVARASLLTDPSAGPYALRPLGLRRSQRELFFDIEADPEREGFVYLHGVLVRTFIGDGAAERFHAFFAPTVDATGEREAFARAFEFLTADAEAPIYYWSKYERTAYRKLQARYPDVCSAKDVESLFDPERAIDLFYDVVLRYTEWPTFDYSIKSLAKTCGFAWRDVDPSGASSIEWFDRWVREGDPALKERIILYNEDDCVACRVVFDRLLGLPLRPG